MLWTPEQDNALKAVDRWLHMADAKPSDDAPVRVEFQ